MIHDLRHASRGLLRSPGFTAAAVLSLALGIGGNVLMFGLADSLVLHPFPYPDPDRLVAIGVSFPRIADQERFIETISAPEYQDIRESRSLHSVIAFDLGNRNISGGEACGSGAGGRPRSAWWRWPRVISQRAAPRASIRLWL